MADGTDELEELEAELDAADDHQDEEASAALSEAQSVLDDAKSTAGGGVDLDAEADADTTTRFFLVAVVGAVAAGFGAGVVPLVDGLVAGGVGVLVMGFALGLASGSRHYLETAVAGAGVLGVLSFLGRLDVAVAAGGSVARLAAVGAGVGLAAAVAGTLGGRLLRGRILDALPGGEAAPGDTPEF
ncbi:hypothetical protein BRD13_05710 [Halobacteriales archaeon SW_5_70_135]|nr:MAG: hypothetical protein BRD13_05710 [Halobacteriales archaeon SW_5_70_135]